MNMFNQSATDPTLFKHMTICAKKCTNPDNFKGPKIAKKKRTVIAL